MCYDFCKVCGAPHDDGTADLCFNCLIKRKLPTANAELRPTINTIGEMSGAPHYRHKSRKLRGGTGSLNWYGSNCVK